jgi:hypothetical protein
VTRRVAVGLSAAMILLPVISLLALGHWIPQPFGVDFDLYTGAAARWLAGGSFYEPYQLARPYPISAGDILYPPVALWLFVPFTVLPAILWWAVPIAMAAWMLWRLRPRHEVWPLVAFCLAWPTTLLKVWTGNPVIWSAGALCLGVVYCWPSVFVLLKPSLFPFALFGANRRAWWLALGAFVALCLPFGPLWADWVTSVQNSTGGGVFYSVLEVPLLLLPIVAWAGRTRPIGTATEPHRSVAQPAEP